MRNYALAFLALLICQSAFSQDNPKRIWFDTDIMMGLPERAPREIDDGVTLIMALAQDNIEIAGITLVTEVEYGEEITNEILERYAPERSIPVYQGSPDADDLGTETAASKALAEALRKEKMAILALGPATNVATVLVNHPELADQMTEIVFCAGRTTGYRFQPGLRQNTVHDYNFEKDVESFRVILNSGVKVVLSGFQCSEYLLLSRTDTDFLAKGSENDQWLNAFMVPWQERARNMFGIPGFIPYDTTPLGYLTHPEYFLLYEDIPVVINYRKNDATMGRVRPDEKHYLEAGREYPSDWKVDFAYRTLPGFEEIVIESLKWKE
ncbi:MAG TPA: nucleoside hydrolase [Cryomorphaceae bacterium]|nr:nucleoside hydrolase [Cryomorphaceae bacterium]